MEFDAALINTIAGTIVAGRCVVFVGAGLSMSANLPNWEGLLKKLISHQKIQADKVTYEALTNALKEKKFQFVAEAVKKRLGKTAYQETLTRIFSPPGGLTPLENHRLLARLPFAAVLTTNYDNLLETAFTNANQGREVFTSVDTSSFVSIANRGKPYILKAHGTIGRPDTIILTQSDYDSIVFDRSVYRDHMKSLLRNYTVLFLGFGLNDPELLLILSQIGVESGQTTGPHYALVDENTIGSSIERDHYYDHYGIDIVSYQPKTTAHTEVTDFLKALVDSVEKSLPSSANKSSQSIQTSKSRVQIPVIVAAMNSSEADELFSGRLFEKQPGLAQRQAVFNQFQQLMSNDSRFQSIQQRYALNRDGWRPPNQSIPWMDWNNQPEDRTILEIVTEVIGRLDSGSVTFEPVFVSEQFFSTDPATRYTVRTNLNMREDGTPVGAIIIIDALSLFFDPLWRDLGGVLENPLNGVFVHSTIGFNEHPLNRLLGDSFFRLPELKTAVYGYIEKLEMRYEMMAGDPLTLRRWLTRVLPDITTPRRNPKNNPWQIPDEQAPSGDMMISTIWKQ